MDSNLQLSKQEFELLNNAEWILTKNVVVKKAQRLLEEVQQNITDYSNQIPSIFPSEVMKVSAKISKGENYRGLPWLMLDYPRYFDKENFFAIRTMFWWGNFFSSTLHLSGKYKQLFSKAIVAAYEELCANAVYVCINEDPWHHHFEKENYVPVKNFTAVEFAALIAERPFIKLSRELSFSKWNDAVRLLSEAFTQITKWLG